jgi:hypothetical protein
VDRDRVCKRLKSLLDEGVELETIVVRIASEERDIAFVKARRAYHKMTKTRI